MVQKEVETFKINTPSLNKINFKTKMKFAVALVVALSTLVVFASCRSIPNDADYIADNGKSRRFKGYFENLSDKVVF